MIPIMTTSTATPKRRAVPLWIDSQVPGSAATAGMMSDKTRLERGLRPLMGLDRMWIPGEGWVSTTEIADQVSRAFRDFFFKRAMKELGHPMPRRVTA